MKTKRNIIAVLALALLCGCQSSGCKSAKSHAEPRLRDGVVDIPVVAAPQELWMAADVWEQPTSSVVMVVSSLNDGSRRVTYFFDIGFEESDWKPKRDTFHGRLGVGGWKLAGKLQDHSGTYLSQGRLMHVGFDTGMHPTTLIVSYETEGTQQTSGDSSTRADAGLEPPQK